MNTLNISHNWKIKSFTSITFCDHCGTLLWGICTQGFQCLDCNFSSHSQCTTLVTVQCNKALEDLTVDESLKNSNSEISNNSLITKQLKNEIKLMKLKYFNRPHNFHKTSKSILKFCNYCKESTFTISGEPVQCSDCRYIAHSHCQEKVSKNCIIPYSLDSPIFKYPSTSNQMIPLTTTSAAAATSSSSSSSTTILTSTDILSNSTSHHWVEGNLKDDKKKCLVCNLICEKTFSLAHYKCLWCNGYIHSSCFEKHNPVCNLGKHSEMILPPGSIELYLDISNNNNSNNGELPDNAALSTSTSTSTNSMTDNSTTTIIVPSSEPKIYNNKPLAKWRLNPQFIPEKALFVFVNSKSGGQFGSVLIRKLSSLLNPLQIIDLIKEGPDTTFQILRDHLEKYPEQLNRFRILVCGGDGTVGWVFKIMTKYDLPMIPIGIIPLGTGNDLARSLGWGVGYDGEKLGDILKSINDAKVVQMDTWSIDYQDNTVDPPNIKTLEMNNYFSIGLDATVALGFHLARNANPQLFTGRTVNKLWYTKIGLEEFVTKSFVKLSKVISIKVGSKEIKFDKSIEGIIILNLGSYAGGVDLWGHNKKSKEDNNDILISPRQDFVNNNSNNNDNGNSNNNNKNDIQDLNSNSNNNGNSNNNNDKEEKIKFKNQYIDDQMLEIIGVTSLPHLGSCLSSISSPIKISQGDEITITVNIPSAENSKNQIETAFQIDGEPEPIESKNCTFTIKFFKKVNMLSNRDFKPRVKNTNLDFSKTVQISSLSPNAVSPPPPSKQHNNINSNNNSNSDNINTPFTISLPHNDQDNNNTIITDNNINNNNNNSVLIESKNNIKNLENTDNTDNTDNINNNRNTDNNIHDNNTNSNSNRDNNSLIDNIELNENSEQKPNQDENN